MLFHKIYSMHILLSVYVHIDVLMSESIDSTRSIYGYFMHLCTAAIARFHRDFQGGLAATHRRYRSQSRHVVSCSAKELPIGAAQDLH